MTDAEWDLEQQVHERWLDFTYEFGNKGFFEEGILQSLEAISQICSIYFGEENTQRGFSRMVVGCLTHRSEDEDWQEILEEDFSEIFSATPVGQLLHDLTAYADQGIVLTKTRDMEQRERLLRKQVNCARKLLNLLPISQWELKGEYLVALINKAVARWKVDNDQPVDAVELALLSGKALQTIKNKMAGEHREISGNQNRVDAKEALAWLKTEKGYKPSLWRDQDDSDALKVQDEGILEARFLPAAKDGSVFHPGIRREGKYQVGEEGSELQFERFDEALSYLQTMLRPQWRRPTAKGVWTRVQAAEWRRVTPDEMGSLGGYAPLVP